MPFLFATLFLTANLFNPLQAEQEVDFGLHDVLTAREFQKYQSKPKYRDRIDLFRNAFDRRADLLRRYVQRKEMEKTADLLRKLHALSHYAAEESSNVKNPKDLRSRQVKKLEIRLRKLIETMNDLKSTAPFEYQDDFEITAQALQDLRKTLLTQIFGEAMAALKSTRREQKRGTIDLLTSLHSPASETSVETRSRHLQSSDRFTDEEYVKIQENQQLDKRVEVFLEIAQSRLEEIRRRREKKEWKKDEENPLEFYTYWDMVHAYQKAIDAIMINIDEKAIYKIASEKDIRNSLKKLYKRIQEFIPQLEPIKQLAIDLQDEALYKKLIKAQETSIIAQKGALYGLGAPEQ
ncbi:hypothetical protein MYX75_11085 [Acidobacteria bacterium AH-259-A15]|nr:hypothetical protein [Acidobacteria bacterium AH-259-A15]